MRREEPDTAPTIDSVRLEVSQLRATVNSLCQLVQDQRGLKASSSGPSDYASLDAHGNVPWGSTPRPRRRKPSFPQPGPPRSTLNDTLDLARSRLDPTGALPWGTAIAEESDDTINEMTSQTVPVEVLSAAQPILSLGFERIMELTNLYEAEVHVVHPCMDIHTFRNTVTHLCELSPLATPRSSPQERQGYKLGHIDVEIVKAVMAIAQALDVPSSRAAEPAFSEMINWSLDTVQMKDKMEIEDLVMAMLQVGCHTRTKDYIS